jgi:hypothetical protein
MTERFEIDEPFRHTMPDGTRWYEFEGKRYIGVTSIEDVSGTSKGLVDWQLRMYMGAASGNPSLVLDHDAWHGAAMSDRNMRMERGTRVHDAIARNVKSTDPGYEDIAPWLRQWEAFCSDYEVTVLLSERRVINPFLEYAGTVDLLLMMAGIPHPVLLDIKTSKRLNLTHALQVRQYSRCNIVIARDYRSIDVEATETYCQHRDAGLLRLGPRSWELALVRGDLDHIWEARLTYAQGLLEYPYFNDWLKDKEDS